MALLMGVGGQYLGGTLSDRFFPERVLLMGLALSLPFLALVGTLQNWPLVGGAAAFAFFYYLSQPAGNHLLARLTPQRWRGRGYGTYFFLSFGMGSFAASFAGYIADVYGLARVFTSLTWVLAGTCLLAFLLYATCGVWVPKSTQLSAS